MISPQDVPVLDINTEELGIQVGTLMENAGKALSQTILDRYGRSKVLMVLGTGNNGGDGMVAARHLVSGGCKVSILMAGDPSRIRTEISRRAFEDLPSEINIMTVEDTIKEDASLDLIDGHDLIVDGLLGSGASGSLRGDPLRAVELIGHGKDVVSIDIPTGLGTSNGISADITVTFHDIKTNMLDENGNIRPECGEIIIKDIGIPPSASIFVGRGDLNRIPKKSRDIHKGEGGKLLVIGGGPFTGAPILASLSGSRTGCDLIRVAVPKGIWQVVASASPCLIAEMLDTEDPFKLGPEIIGSIEPMIDWADAVLIGPGSGRDSGTLQTLKEVIDLSISKGKRTCIDADGITSISRKSEDWTSITGDNVLITPHRSEFKRLLNGTAIDFEEDRMNDPYLKSADTEIWSDEALDPAEKFTKLTGTSILVKGRIDMIMTPHGHSLNEHILHDHVHVRYNRTGVPEMSVGGTGDLLSGLCAGFMARGMGAFNSGCIASYVNGKAGEMCRKRMGISLTALDILDSIPYVLSGSSSLS